MRDSPRRGEVWWVVLDPARGSELQKARPCVVITIDIVNSYRRTVVVVPLSTGLSASPPFLVHVRSIGKPAVAVLDQIRAIAKERLRERLGVLAPGELNAIEDGLRDILEL